MCIAALYVHMYVQHVRRRLKALRFFKASYASTYSMYYTARVGLLARLLTSFSLSFFFSFTQLSTNVGKARSTPVGNAQTNTADRPTYIDILYKRAYVHQVRILKRKELHIACTCVCLCVCMFLTETERE